MSKQLHKALSIIMGVLLLVSMLFISREMAEIVTSKNIVVEQRKYCVLIDAGHGGDDPGKVGINGTLEKDVNLNIALALKDYLEAADVNVVMTRTDENGLYDPDASNKKVQDMKRRIEVMEEVKPDLTVSIHQNSYPEEYVHGAQVFYYTGSKEGENLADLIQKQMVEKTDPDNKRQIKPNNSYYLLKKTKVPIVIVECGFLSNTEEANKLSTPEYQARIAWSIHLGILRYLNEFIELF